MEERFKTVVQHIFNNWTGLQLAVEHGMGGANSSQVAMDFINYVTQYCLEKQNVDSQDIQELLEDILDEEFETICEDNSTAEIATALFRFLSLLKEGNVAQYEIEYHNLPTCQLQLSRPLTEPISTHVEDCSKADLPANTSTPIPMEEDSEWTEVKSRRKK